MTALIHGSQYCHFFNSKKINKVLSIEIKSICGLELFLPSILVEKFFSVLRIVNNCIRFRPYSLKQVGLDDHDYMRNNYFLWSLRKQVKRTNESRLSGI